MVNNIKLPRSCSASSTSTREQLFGSAPVTKTWILLEYPVPWAAKALEESKLPQAVKDYLQASMSVIDGSRFVFINPHRETRDKKTQLFIALPQSTGSRLFNCSLEQYEDILEIPLGELATGIVPDTFQVSIEPIYLVCTNGRRDPCCGKLGVPVYQAIQQIVGRQVYECSHVGGHRFAANVITIPDGYYYGRVTTENISEIIHSSKRGEVYHPKLRGRSSYKPFEQAAEYYVRERTQIRGIDKLQLSKSQKISDDKYQVAFINGKVEYTISMSSTRSQNLIFESCHQPDKLVHPLTYVMDNFEAQTV